MNASVDSPIVIRFGGMGDMIMLLPALKYLHEKYGRGATLICKGSWNRTIYSRLPYVERVVVASRSKAPAAFWGPRSFWRQFRSLPTSDVPVYVADETSRYHRQLLSWLGTGEDQVCRVDGLQRRYREHDGHFYQRLCSLNPSGRATWPVPPIADVLTNRLPLTTSEIERGAAWIDRQGCRGKKLVLVHIGNKKTTRLLSGHDRASNVKHWPIHCWQETLDRLARLDPSMVFVLTGTRNERTLLNQVSQRCRSASLRNSAGQLSLPLLMGVMQHAHSMISVDTGPAHLAAAIGCPLTVLFTATNSYAFSPIGGAAPVQVLRYERTSHHQGNPDELVPERVVERHAEIEQCTVASVA